MRSPASPSPRPAPPASPTCCAGTGPSRRCTTSAMSPSPRTAPKSAPAPAPTSWRPCATWSSACSAGPGRSTSPPRCATTPATPPGPWPPSPSLPGATTHEQPSRERRSAGSPPDPGQVGLADFFQAQVEDLPDDVLGDRLGLGEADRALGQVVAGKPALDRGDHVRAEREQAQVVLEGGKAQERLPLVSHRGGAVAARFLSVGHPVQDDAADALQLGPLAVAKVLEVVVDDAHRRDPTPQAAAAGAAPRGSGGVGSTPLTNRAYRENAGALRWWRDAYRPPIVAARSPEGQ